MIIKDKPFHVPCCQAMLCWYYASPVVAGFAIPSPSGCDLDLVRRWPGFVKLEAYQVRLSSILADRFTSYRLTGEWTCSSEFLAQLKAVRAGGVL